MNQLNDKMSQIQNLLNNEKLNKELWINKFEHEQKLNSENSVQLLNIQSIIKDKDLLLSKFKMTFDL